MKLGLALGGGGARGLAHIPLLQVFDDLEIRPDFISGTSAGAIVGALYASGMSAKEIKEWVDDMIVSRGEGIQEILHKKNPLKAFEFFDLSFKQTGFLKGKKFVLEMGERMGVSTFDALKIPLSIIASDFWTQEQVVFDKGDLLLAIRASICLPGVFTPVEHEGKILVDGGGVNPVPHDVLTEPDTTIAIDVMGFPEEDQPEAPNLFRTVIGTFDVMQSTIIELRLQANPPNLYLKPDLRGFDLLDFHENEAIYEAASDTVEELREWLTAWKRGDR